MESQALFKSSFIDSLELSLEKGRGFNDYMSDVFTITKSETLENPRIQVAQQRELIIPDESGNHDFENAKRIYETYKLLSRTQASDPRLWTYLTHSTYWMYMRKRWPVEDQPAGKRGEYILDHYFIFGPGPNALSRNGISSLWWGAFLTYDSNRDDPYELTKELFSMLDYTRTIIYGTQGRNNNFTRAVLEFVIENGELFKSNKQDKVRLLMRRMNFLGGYKVLLDYSEDEIKEILKSYSTEIANLKLSEG